MKYSILLYICIFAFSLLFSNIQTILLSLFILAGGILYTEGLKKVPILGWKSYYVSFFWALLILIVPLFYELKNFIPYYYLVAFIFIRGIVNTTYSDIKDIESDKARGVKALAAHWGKEKTLYILQIINMLSLTPIIIGIYKGDLPSIAIVMSLTVLNGVYYLTKSLYIDQNKIRIFTNLLIDGEYILWPIFIVIAKLLT